MPDYVLMSEMNGLIPAAFLVQALDDNSDGAADAAAWTDVLRQVHRAIDGPLGSKFAVPFNNPLPPIVLEAAPIFAAELLYKRRGTADDANPWVGQANKLREKINKIAAGELPLTPDIKKANASIAVVSETSKLSRRGRTAT